MFTESSNIYDLIYSSKDYKKESEKLINLINLNAPDAKTILDICCGTAEHHNYLSSEFLLEGLDINQEFINLAKVKNPTVTYHTADMTEFNLDKEYDVLICLFSSIGYVKTFEKLTSTLKCFYQHLKNGGFVIVEPWITPEKWQDGKIHMQTYEKDNLKICRMNQSAKEGNLAILNFHYLFATADNGVKHFEERHELALFTKEEMKKAFNEADLEVTYEEEGITGRGLYFGRKKTLLKKPIVG